ncbi:MAG: S49 family peptidase [Syntrophales bacterium]|jgi:signal peptide peptidase SppA|nr:S49 family peptidase [Syntrophales bacterium]
MDKRAYPHQLINGVFNKPLLISPYFVSTLGNALRAWESIGATTDLGAKMIEMEAAAESRLKLNIVNGAAVIGVYNYLTYRADFCAWMMFGNTSYEEIRAQHQAALADPNVKSIVFRIASPGGEVAGCFDLADDIYQARGQKPTYAVFDDYGYSAAYAIASAADKRYIARTGSAGSIGVILMHIDQSERDKNTGLSFTPIYAGSHKVDFSSHAPLSPEAKAVGQEMVNTTCDLFVNTVARNLGIAPAAVRGTEAMIYDGKKAVDIGFADSVLSWDQFLAKLNNRKYGGVMKAEIEKLFNSFRDSLAALVSKDASAANQEVVTKADAEKLVAAAEALARSEGLAAGKTEGKNEAQARSATIMEACELAHIPLKDALAYVKDETLSTESARAKIVEAQASEADRKKVTSTVGALSTGDVNPLLAEVGKRAGAK